MAYRFKLDERICDAHIRIADEQFDHALKCLGDEDDPVTGIHGARKCIKRLRALLRLVRPGVPKSNYRYLNTMLRDAGRELSAARDRDVMLATISDLASQSEHLGSALQPVSKRLSGNASDDDGGSTILASPFVTRKARKLLRKARETWHDVPFEADGMGPVAKGLTRGMKEMRKALAATASGEEEPFHDLRKTVQRHWRHMRLLEAGQPEYFGARAEAAKTISELLGRAQDLTLVLRHMHEQAGEEDDQATEAANEVQHRRDTLQHEALAHTKKLLSEAPKAHARHAVTLWSSARKAAGKKPAKAISSPVAPTAAPTRTAASAPLKRSASRHKTSTKRPHPRRNGRSADA